MGSPGSAHPRHGCCCVGLTESGANLPHRMQQPRSKWGCVSSSSFRALLEFSHAGPQPAHMAKVAHGQQARKCGSKNKNCAAKNALECKGLLKDSPRLEVRYALTVGRNGMTLRHPNWSYEAVCCCKACLEQHPRPLIMTPSYPMPSTCMSLSSIDF